MFLAGADVWHFAGSPDFCGFRLSEYDTDLRVFAYAFYFQFLILLAMVAVTSWTGLKVVRPTRQ